MYNGYKDIKKAADDEVKGIWGGWLVGGILWTLLAMWTDGVWLLGTLVYYLWFVLGVISTGAAIWFSIRAWNKADNARGNTLR